MLNIIQGGCNSRHPSTFFIKDTSGPIDYLLIITKTPCIFQMNNENYDLSPRSAVIVPPGTRYYYTNPRGEYIDDWMHFQSEDEIFPYKGILNTSTFFHVDDPEFYSIYIRQLLWESSYANPSCRTENIHSLFTVLFNHLLSAYQNKKTALYYNPYRRKLQEMRITMQSTIKKPLSIQELADQLGVSKSYFQHLYKEIFGISFQKDYIQLKISCAKDLLETTKMPVEQILEVCGYSSEVHFYRQFKAITNLTPADYRKMYGKIFTD